MSEILKRIRAKYPQYDDIGDADLASRILAKYPQYKDTDLVTVASQPAAVSFFGDVPQAPLAGPLEPNTSTRPIQNASPSPSFFTGSSVRSAGDAMAGLFEGAEAVKDSASETATMLGATKDYFSQLGQGIQSLFRMPGPAGVSAFVESAKNAASIPEEAIAETRHADTDAILPALADAVRQDMDARADYYTGGAQPETFWEKVKSGAGSVTLPLATGPAAPLAIAAMMGEHGREDAEMHGATPEQQRRALYGNAAIGLATEPLLGVPALLSSIKNAAPGVASVFKQMGLGSLREGAQEGIQQVGGNVLANTLVGYDPDRKTSEGVKEAVQIGATVGPMFSGPMQVASNIDASRARKKVEEAAAKAAAEDARRKEAEDLSEDLATQGMYDQPDTEGVATPLSILFAQAKAEALRDLSQGMENENIQLEANRLAQERLLAALGLPQPNADAANAVGGETASPVDAAIADDIIDKAPQKRESAGDTPVIGGQPEGVANIFVPDPTRPDAELQTEPEQDPRAKMLNRYGPGNTFTEPEVAGDQREPGGVTAPFPYGQTSFNRRAEAPLTEKTREAGFSDVPDIEIPLSERFGEEPDMRGNVEKIRAAIQRLKVDTGGKMFDGMMGLPIAIRNGLLTAADLAVQGGATLHEAGQAGLDWLKKNHPDATINEKEYWKFFAKLGVEIDSGDEPKNIEEAASAKPAPVSDGIKPAPYTKSPDEALLTRKGFTETDKLGKQAVDEPSPYINPDPPESMADLDFGLDPDEQAALGEDEVGVWQQIKDVFSEIKEDFTSDMDEKNVAHVGSDKARAIVDTSNRWFRRQAKRFGSKVFEVAADTFLPATGKGKLGKLGYEHQQVRDAGVLLNQLNDRVFSKLEETAKTMPRKARKRMFSNISEHVRRDDLPELGGELGKAVNAVREFQRELLEYQREAGVEIGDAGFYKLVRNTDEKKVIANKYKFLRQARKYFTAANPEMFQEDVEAAAQDLFNKYYYREAGFDPSNSNPFGTLAESALVDSSKKRKLSHLADRYFADFYHSDITELMTSEVLSAVKRAVTAKTFSTQDADGNIEKWGVVRQWQEQLHEDGVPGSVIEEFTLEVADAITGFRGYAKGPRNTAATLTTATMLSLMGGSTITSQPEPLLAGAYTGRIRDGITTFGNTYKNWLIGLNKTKDAREQRYATEVLGIIGDTLNEYANVSKYGGAMSDTKTARKIGSWFMKMIGLDQFTNSTRIAIQKLAHSFLRLSGQKILDGSSKVGIREQLVELGIPVEEHTEFAEWITDPDWKLPESFDLKDESSMARRYLDAQHIFNNQVAMRPTNVTRNRLSAKSPYWAVAYSLSSYMYTFSETILQREQNKLQRAGKLAVDKVTGKEDGEFRPDLLAGAAAMGAVFLAAMGWGEFRWHAWNTKERKNKNERDNTDRVLEAFSRSGMTGRYDTLLNVLMGITWQRDPATVLAGPLPGKLSSAVSSMVKAAQSDDSTNTAERGAANQALSLTQRPGVSAVASLAWGLPGNSFGVNMVKMLASVATLSAHHPRSREFVIDSTLGPPTPKKSRTTRLPDNEFTTGGNDFGGGGFGPDTF